MPSKSKRKTKRQPLNISNENPSATGKTIVDYFPPSPPSENNNNSGALQITSETVYYDGPLLKDALESKSNGYAYNYLLTPEESPEKAEEVVKSEACIVGSLAQPVLSDHSITRSEETPVLSTSSSQSTLAHKSEDSSAAASKTEGSKAKPKRRARQPKVKTADTKPNHLVTDFFPVRKSSRKTAKELQREQEEMMRNMILDECENGLRIVHYDGKGRGVEATKPFRKGDFIVEYAGDLVELKEAKSREETYKKDVSYGCYMYFFNHKGKSYCIDATRESGKLGRLLNHSRTKPNCATKTIDIGDRAYLILVAARDIEVGEELVYDYGDRSKEAIENNPWLKE